VSLQGHPGTSQVSTQRSVKCSITVRRTIRPPVPLQAVLWNSSGRYPVTICWVPVLGPNPEPDPLCSDPKDFVQNLAFFVKQHCFLESCHANLDF
jgi:hypothetical protein